MPENPACYFQLYTQNTKSRDLSKNSGTIRLTTVVLTLAKGRNNTNGHLWMNKQNTVYAYTGILLLLKENVCQIKLKTG